MLPAVRKKLGEFVQNAAFAMVPKRFGLAAFEQVRRKTAMAENVGALGGYTVPEEIQLGVDEHLREIGIFHALAYRQPMASRTCRIPIFDLTASHNAGTSPLTGGMVCTWTAEGVAATESEPTVAVGNLVAKDLIGFGYISNQLLQDGGDSLGSYLENMFAKANESYVERACFVGSGIGQPLGVVNAPATVQVTRGGAGTIAVADAASMVASLLPASFTNAVWSCSLTALSKIVQLSAFGNLVALNPHPRLVGTFFGRPLYVTENLPAVGSAGDLVLFDPTMYALGTREIEIAFTDEEPTGFVRNQTTFRTHWRGDGQPLPRNTFTAADGSTTVGCFVALK